jgi:hypothetical protein
MTGGLQFIQEPNDGSRFTSVRIEFVGDGRRTEAERVTSLPNAHERSQDLSRPPPLATGRPGILRIAVRLIPIKDGRRALSKICTIKELRPCQARL